MNRLDDFESSKGQHAAKARKEWPLGQESQKDAIKWHFKLINLPWNNPASSYNHLPHSQK
jgi:hypothetical protein